MAADPTYTRLVEVPAADTVIEAVTYNGTVIHLRIWLVTDDGHEEHRDLLAAVPILPAQAEELANALLSYAHANHPTKENQL